jgi:hypothetical protein
MLGEISRMAEHEGDGAAMRKGEQIFSLTSRLLQGIRQMARCHVVRRRPPQHAHGWGHGRS